MELYLSLLDLLPGGTGVSKQLTVSGSTGRMLHWHYAVLTEDIQLLQQAGVQFIIYVEHRRPFVEVSKLADMASK